MIPQAYILFDGDCNLCNRLVRFVQKRDPQKRFSFLPLHSDEASSLLGSISTDDDTMYLVQEGTVYQESEAALRVLGQLKTPLKYLHLLRYLPLGLRDRGYRFVARNRHRFFKQTQCTLAD